MSPKINLKNIKIIQFKDIISISIILIIIALSICSVVGNNFYVSDKPVTARNLAMFASIAYADLENIPNYNISINSNSTNIPTPNLLTEIKSNDLTFKEVDMVTDEQLSTIKSSTTLLGIPLSDEEEDTYSYLFYNLASTDEVSEWKIVNYTKFNTTVFKGTAQFTAMTFKRGNDIVIAYRGTDFDDIGDWTQDIFYGLVGYAGQEGVTQDYARVVAEYYTKNNPNINIYVTGHSLGGYLAQIGGAALADNQDYSDNLKEVSYFNGMGLQFWSNITSLINSSTRSKFNINNYEYKQLTNNSSTLNTIQNKAKIALTDWKNNGGKLISYNINGDLISSLGTHVGEQKGFNAHNICINHHNGNQSTTDVLNEIEKKLSKNFLKLISLALNKDISIYVEQYSPSDFLNYIWITHETDSFFGVLPYEDGSLPPNIEVEFTSPSTIKYNKTATSKLTVTTIGGPLASETLKTNNFSISNKNKLKLISVSSPEITKTDNGYKYVYNIKLKGGIVVGNSIISLKANSLKLKVDNNLCSSKFCETSNNIIRSKNIKTKLR